jgi:hypothetical protein
MTLDAIPTFSVFDIDEEGSYQTVDYCGLNYRFGYEIYEEEQPTYYTIVPNKESVTYIKITSKEFLKILETHLKKEDVIEYVHKNLIKS